MGIPGRATGCGMLRGFGSADTLGPWRNQASPSAEAMRSRFVRCEHLDAGRETTASWPKESSAAALLSVSLCAGTSGAEGGRER